MISSKRSTGKKKRWHCALSNCSLTDINNSNWKIKKVRIAKHTRVRKLCWLLLIILFKISKTPLRPIITLPADVVMFVIESKTFLHAHRNSKEKKIYMVSERLWYRCVICWGVPSFPARTTTLELMPGFPVRTTTLELVAVSKSPSTEELLKAGNLFRKYAPKNQLNLWNKIWVLL